jgi:small subunit ribosomal protein S6
LPTCTRRSSRSSSGFNGTLDKTENWGRKRLAYDIGHHREGNYVVETITGSGELMKEIDRRLRVIDQVIRHLVVRVDEELRVAQRTSEARKAFVARRRVARGLAARSGSRVKDEATAILRTTWKVWRPSDEGRTRRRPRPRRRQEGRQGSR